MVQMPGEQVGDRSWMQPSQGSGALLLVEEQEALCARIALARGAEHSIDVQYYIWAGDAVGIAIIEELLRAALRGVRIRLLVDDIHFIGYDRRVLALDAYHNVEIRSFNPFRYRFKDAPFRSIAEILSGAARLNHRMHNKVFAVDGQVAILGGRNLSNAYFGAHPSFNFRDIDVLVSGQAMSGISRSFDDFWNSEWAVPLRTLHKRRIKPLVLDELKVGLGEHDLAVYQRIEQLDIAAFVARCSHEMVFCHVEVLSDSPQKMFGHAGFVSPVRERLFELTEQACEEVLIENGYFIPGEEGLQRLQQQLQRGVAVKVLTNSLASNDTGLSHAGYQRYRRRLLKAGIALYEYRDDAEDGGHYELIGLRESNVGLHSKAATLDRKLAFVGSYNLDPRSAFINTEIGVIVHDPAFSENLARAIEQGMQRANSWWVRLAPDDSLRWQHAAGLSREPNAGYRKRLLAMLLAMLPVERQL